jgi:hypothetical protein
MALHFAVSSLIDPCDTSQECKVSFVILLFFEICNGFIAHICPVNLD